MTALAGKPLRIARRLDDYDGKRKLADYEIHHPAPGTELVVCGDCGFTWDADHTVKDDAGQVGHECPMCVMVKFVEARQRVIEDTVRKGGKVLAQSLRLRTSRLERACLDAVAFVRGIGSPRPPMFDQDEHRLRRMRDALWAAGFNVDSRPTSAPSPGKLASQVAFARDTWRNDGAEGETVHGLCDEIDRLTGVTP